MTQYIFFLTIQLHVIFNAIFAARFNSKNDLGGGMLRPQDSESRETKLLDGMWDFRVDSSPTRNKGFEDQWYKRLLKETGAVLSMPVPSSYNDIGTDKSLRDFVGWAWYERTFYVPLSWKGSRIMLRFDSAHYNAVVWLNGVQLMTHSGGHLPFEADASSLMPGSSARLTVAVNNTLNPHTLPPGTVQHQGPPRFPAGYVVQNLQFDFFNYAGLHRHVWLYSTPKTHVDDVTIVTGFSGTTGTVQYTISVIGGSDADIKVDVLDNNGAVVASGNGTKGQLSISNVNLWWPWTMSGTERAYLYTLRVNSGGSAPDVYRQRFGVRTVRVSGAQFLINDRPFYCQGAAKHEDADIRGKGLDLPTIARDFALLRWMGANCFRSSHYPYAEEILDMADVHGVAVIDESPGVGIKQVENFSPESLAHHLEVEAEQVRRDKNRPAVIMWSVANEPASAKTEATNYFKSVIERVRQLDPTRPVTYVVGGADFNTDKAAQFVDVLCINHYFAWYSDTGHTEVIPYQLKYDLDGWFSTFNKPVMITEYGADTVSGLHTLPSFVFTEDYQRDFLSQYHGIFDQLRKNYFVGEMVWNFADFMTDQTVTRVVGNKKGLFTRQRQPKAAAWLIRERYMSLINSTQPAV